MRPARTIRAPISGFVDGVQAVRGFEVCDHWSDHRGSRADEFGDGVSVSVGRPYITGTVNGDAEGAMHPTAQVCSRTRDRVAGGVELTETTAEVRHPNVTGTVDCDTSGSTQAAPV